MVDLVDRRDRDNATPLMHASARNGTIEKIRALLAKGANVHDTFIELAQKYTAIMSGCGHVCLYTDCSWGCCPICKIQGFPHCIG